jgi:hypothetical protein
MFSDMAFSMKMIAYIFVIRFEDSRRGMMREIVIAPGLTEMRPKIMK